MSCCDHAPRPLLPAVLLAAGASTRMGGRPKALLEIAGEPLVLRLARQLLEAGFSPITVVVGAHATAIRERVANAPERLADALHCVENPDWAKGVGGSLTCGLTQALGNAAATGVLVAPVDLPATRVEDWERLRVRFLAAGRTVAVRHAEDGQLGTPVLFLADDARTLLSTTGSEGAKHWLRKNAARVEIIDCPRLCWDADTPDALAQLLARP
ncbi:NTP transferase domain-containing protein [Nibricoccus sp. IMCC34717]|uniref:nucleotidyltransferase family protein n=1 Tax=Nibricoccus sp. IMCC34717 TaxID=3034021 RepID=UPI00384C5062